MNNVKLKDLCEIIKGIEPGSESYSNDGISFLRVSDLKTNGSNALKTSANKLVTISKNDIIMSLDGTPGIVSTGLEGAISGGLRVFKPKNDKLYDRYLYWYLQSPNIQEVIARNSTGAIIKHAGKSVNHMTINLLNLNDQIKIAHKLDLIEESINILEKIKNEYKNLIYAKFKDLFEIDFSNSACYSRLIDICDFIDYRGKTPTKTNSGIPLITAKNVKEDYFSTDPQEYISEEEFSVRMTRGIPEYGDVLFTTEAPLANVCIMPNINSKFSVGQRIITLKCKNNITNQYLKYALLNNQTKQEIYKKSTGSTVKGIKSKFLKEIKIPIPNIDKQIRFNDFANIIEKEIMTIDNSLSSLNSLLNNEINLL